jgi:nigerose phosphorylase
MNDSSWSLKATSFNPDDVELNGNRFLLGNGYMGYRGTLDEFANGERTACILSGVYDKVGDAWREPINAPNGLFTTISCDGLPLNVLAADVAEHEQVLDFRAAVHRRRTVFIAPGGVLVTAESERFVDGVDVHSIAIRYSFSVSQDSRIVVDTGIDGDVWDLSGPHLEDLAADHSGECITLSATTHELRETVAVAESFEAGFDPAVSVEAHAKSITRHFAVDAVPGRDYVFRKYVAVYTSKDCADPLKSAVAACVAACSLGYESVKQRHEQSWRDRWDVSDVRIAGDDEAQFALRYSIYHLLAIAPSHSDKVSIPARGLSAQVYKGAVFWDTEMFMIPFFLFTNPDLAGNLVRYRINTLDGARRKAAEYGFCGAYYAWESQDTGDDACTHFAFNDVFTGRPMRTYFRDKQVHITADVARAIWQYYQATEDESILLEGGAEALLECARFYVSYGVYKTDRKRFEILDVTGPDEYHERVGNDAFTNAMARHTLDIALQAVAILGEKHPNSTTELLNRLDISEELETIRTMRDQLYIPRPNPQTLVIEQFDGYFRLEDASVETVKNRMVDPGEYLGGGNGVASNTQVIKQADTILMLHVFKDQYSRQAKAANWAYYEPRTEHGSSLSPCVYGMVAADVGDPEWAYKYFLKTATVDLESHGRQTVGGIYLGGTHPAANGGAWMAAVLGFAGAALDGSDLALDPHLPSKWETMSFTAIVRGQRLDVTVGRSSVRIEASPTNSRPCVVRIAGRPIECGIGTESIVSY